MTFLYSVGHAEGGAVLGPGAGPVVEPGGGHVRVAEPLLHFAQVGAPIQGVGGGRGPQGVRPKAGENQPGGFGVLAQRTVVNGPVGGWNWGPSRGARGLSSQALPVGAGDLAHLLGPLDAGEGREVPDVEACDVNRPTGPAR
jgi:hypothetical protein